MRKPKLPHGWEPPFHASAEVSALGFRDIRDKLKRFITLTHKTETAPMLYALNKAYPAAPKRAKRRGK